MQRFLERINAAYFLAGLGIIIGFGILFYVYDHFKLKNADTGLVTQIFFADNISNAHRKLIERFNEEFKGQIEVIPIDLPFSKFSTNERKELLARSLRSKSERIDVFAVDLIWVPRFARWGQPVGNLHSGQRAFPHHGERSAILLRRWAVGGFPVLYRCGHDVLSPGYFGIAAGLSAVKRETQKGDVLGRIH